MRGESLLGRVTEIDALRGVAILMMVVYHFIFDINYFGFAPIDLFSLPLLLFQRATGSLFILLVGVSLTLSESRNKEGYIHHAKRALFLGAIAVVITIATWIYPHEGFIQFGIIHFIAVSTLVAPFFFRFGKLNVLLGVLVIAAGLYMGGLTTDSHYLFWLGITYPGYTALDHYPIFPWFGVVLIGIFAGQTLFPGGKPIMRLKGNPVLQKLSFLGRNSLVIYLVHQPIIIGAMALFRIV